MRGVGAEFDRTTDVDVWWVDLHRMEGPLDQHVAHLSTAEREHLARLRRRESRTTFAITRAVLRRLLAAQLAIPAHSLRFSHGRYGKPSLPDHPALEFNVAHTAGMAVIALSRRGPVGVDVERLEPRLPIDELARRCFSAAEITALRDMSGDDHLRGFFDGWARKEAFVKALGKGLSHDMASFSVTIAPEKPATLLGTPAKRWAVVDLDAGPTYAAALVAPRTRTHAVPREFSWCGS